MAIYHCSVKVIGRNAGRSAVAAAAYRAGEKLTNVYDGVEHDFTRKNWIEFKEIICPDNAPKEYQERSQLWNAVEKAEKSSNAQLAREFEVALPKEMTRQQQIEVVETFIKENLVSQGMIADVVIHNPPVMNDRHQPIDVNGNVTTDKDQMQFINPHAHILCTVRPIDKNGKWEKKSQIEYICKKDKEEKAFTADEFKDAKLEGWEKQYLYYMGKKKEYYTASEAEEKDLKRVNRTPKTTRYGRKNPTVEYWNSKQCLYEWRKQWGKIVNDKFESMKSNIRIDHRSFKDQGKEEIPTVHMGVSATNMEKRAEREIKEGKEKVEFSDVGNLNREIKRSNRLIQKLKETIEHFSDNLQNVLERLRDKLRAKNQEEELLRRNYKALEQVLGMEQDRITKYEMEQKKVEEADDRANKKIDKLNIELEKYTFLQMRKKNKIQKEIQREKEGIKNREKYLKDIHRMCEFKDNTEYYLAKSQYMKKMRDSERIKENLDLVKEEKLQIIKEYEKLGDYIKESKRDKRDKEELQDDVKKRLSR